MIIKVFKPDCSFLSVRRDKIWTISHLFWFYWVNVKTIGIFFPILWPSLNIFLKVKKKIKCYQKSFQVEFPCSSLSFLLDSVFYLFLSIKAGGSWGQGQGVHAPKIFKKIDMKSSPSKDILLSTSRMSSTEVQVYMHPQILGPSVIFFYT